METKWQQFVIMFYLKEHEKKTDWPFTVIHYLC